MNTKNQLLLTGMIFTVIGFAIGWVVFMKPASTTGLHQMPNGEMMTADGMTMEDMMHAMNANLEGKTGDAFDEAFIDEMIVHHQGAIDMAELARTNAGHTEIKKLAEDIITAQTKEIQMMKDWKMNWFTE